MRRFRFSVQLFLISLLVVGCAPKFDDTRLQGWDGTLGEEIYKVVCQRMGSEAARQAHDADPSQPYDVTGDSTRALCEGTADPSTAPSPRVRALAENRDRLVAALDASMPEDMEDDLRAFLLQLLPFYDPPVERFPTETREIAQLFGHLMNDRSSLEAYARIGGRDGYRPVPVALGVARPALAWDGLRDFLQVGLATIGDGGVAHDQWIELLEALALEMATTVPDAPGELTTRDIGRQLILSTHDDFSAGELMHLPVRDRRGLPVPTTIEAPFVDMDLDGLADADDKGHFVDASGAILDVPTPYPAIDEAPSDRDSEGRAVKADLVTPLYQYYDVDRSLLAGLSRELLNLVDPSDPVLMDFMYGLRTMFGGDAPGATDDTIGVNPHSYTGIDTASGPIFDVVHAVSIVLARDEGDEVLEVANVLMQPQYEPLLGALVESGLIGQANGDLDPDAQMIPEQELWDDLLEIVTIMAQDGILEDVLRTFTDPQAVHTGQILAEMMRHTDTPTFDPVAVRSAPRMVDDLYSVEVVRQTAGGAPVREWLPGSMVEPYPSAVENNLSLFGQSMAVIHELNGDPFCNKEGASFHDLFGGGTALDAILNALMNAIFPGGFAECALLDLQDLTYQYALSVTGRLHLQLKDGTAIAQLISFLNGIGLSGTTDALMTFLLSTGMDIPDLTVYPDPFAMNRLVFGEPTSFTQNLIDPAVTRYGDIITDRYKPIVFAWERMFCFDGDQLVETWPCDPPLQQQGYYEALVPLLNVLIDHKEANPSRPFLFGMIVDAVWDNWTSPQDTMFQSSDPMGPRYVARGNGISYENLTADLLADCGWDMIGAGRSCDVDRSAHMWSRTIELMQELDDIVLPSGHDGIYVLARALEVMADPLRSPGLTNRAGELTTFTNAGTRELDQTPMYLLLDALNDMDATFAAADPMRHDRWLAARSRLVDELMLTVPDPGGSDGYVLENRRVHALLEVLIPFLQERIAEHEGLGDRQAWALGLSDRFEASMGSAIASGIIRMVDAIQQDPDARDQLGLLATYLTNELSANGAFEATVMAIADLMQWMEDDANVPAIVNGLAEGAALNAVLAADGTGTLDPAGGTMNRTIDFLRDVNEVDDKSALARLLANAVTPPPGSDETPIEVILDVIAEVNRAAPGQGDSLEADDYEILFQNSIDFMTDEYRGLERLYDIVQDRELP